jgi:anti-sigma factor NepR-like protein
MLTDKKRARAKKVPKKFPKPGTIGKTVRWPHSAGLMRTKGGFDMGERGKNDEMKHRRTNLEAVEPETDKSASDKPETRDSMGAPVNPPKPEARLGREVQAKIGQQLRSMYDDVVNQGVPQHIADLVRRLGDQD